MAARTLEGNRQERQPWIGLIPATLLLVCAASQLLVPGLPLTASDLLTPLALLGTLVILHREHERLTLPAGVVLFLLVFALASLGASGGAEAARELVQRTGVFVVGLLAIQALLQRRPGWAVATLSAGLALNVAVVLLRGSPQDPGVAFGLFRSRMAFATFAALAGTWLFPVLTARAETWRAPILGLAFGLLLAAIPYGQVLLFMVPVLVLVALMHGCRARFVLTLALLVMLAGFTVLSGADARRQTVLETLSPFRNGTRIRQAHTELVAAARMANDRPWTGFGAGRYQTHIGRFYGRLPNPSINDIETDTQGGWGIVMASTGYLTTAALLLMLLQALARALQRYQLTNQTDSLQLGAAGALLLALPLLAITDPFVRGVCWTLAVPLATATVPSRAAHDEAGGLRAGPVAILVWGLLFAALAATLWLRRSPETTRPGAADATRPGAIGEQVTARSGDRPTEETGTGTPAAGLTVDFEAYDFLRVLDAADAVTMTPPMERLTAPEHPEGPRAVLWLADETCTPAEDAPPSMEFGGAEYVVHAPAPFTAAAWFRVWWSGACGNSLYFQIDEQDPVVVGNDGTYEAWHWVRVPETIRLAAGENRFLLMNREDGMGVDQILITGDLDYVPQGLEIE